MEFCKVSKSVKNKSKSLRVTIPTNIRKYLNLQDGDIISWDEIEDKQVIVSKINKNGTQL